MSRAHILEPSVHRLARDAVSRGIPVTVVTPRENNKKPIKEYILWEAARSALTFASIARGMTHMKAMLIDETYLIVGSCNFDISAIALRRKPWRWSPTRHNRRIHREDYQRRRWLVRPGVAITGRL